MNGGIVSPMTAYFSSRIFKDTCVRNALVADALRARPPIYTTTSTDNAFDERDLEHVGEIDGLKASMQANNMLSRNKIQMSVHERQEELVGMLNRRTLNAKDSDKNFRTDPLTRIQNYDYNIDFNFHPIVPLALDTTVCAVPQAQGRGDLVSIFDNVARMACVCFGVNAESIGLNAGSSHASADAIQQSNQVTLSTVHKFKGLLALWHPCG